MITRIRKNCFVGNTNITSVISPNVTEVDNRAFYNCNTLKSIDLPYTTAIGSEAFRHKEGSESPAKLTNINLPRVESIGSYAFANQDKLTSLYLPACKTIKNSAFYRCNNILTVTLNSLELLEDQAFYYCTALTALTLGGSSVCTVSGRNCLGGCNNLTYIYVPAELVDAYKADEFWTRYGYIIEAIHGDA